MHMKFLKFQLIIICFYKSNKYVNMYRTHSLQSRIISSETMENSHLTVILLIEELETNKQI